MPKAKSQADTLTTNQMKKVLSRCEIMASPQTKKAIMVLSWSTMRVTELAQVLVSDLMHPSGQIKQEVSLRANLCKNRRPRTIWLSSMAIEVLQEWFSYRVSKRWGCTYDNEYQTLNPASKVIYNNRGRSYSLKRKTRINQSGDKVDYLAADCIELEIRKIYQRCGLRGCSSHSGRRARATSLNKQGIPLNTIQRILGHSKPSMTITYIDISSCQLSTAAEMAL